jgi:hypothetical protein
MFSRSSSRVESAFPALALFAAIAGGCGHGGSALAPSTIVNSPSNYDGQTITVAGTVRDVSQVQGRRGPMTRYHVCDNTCITVFQFGDTNVSEKSSTTVTGMFHETSRRNANVKNVLIVRPDE